MYFIMYFFFVGLTVSYSVRLAYYSMIVGTNSYSCQSYFEAKLMNVSMIFLVLMSILSGSMISWLIFSTPVFCFFLMIPFLMKILSLVMIISGLIIGYEFSIFYYNVNSYFLKNCPLSFFLSSMWFMPPLSTYFLMSGFLNYSFNLNKNLEVGWGEFIFSKLSFHYLVILSKFTQLYYLFKMMKFTWFLSFYLFLFL